MMQRLSNGLLALMQDVWRNISRYTHKDSINNIEEAIFREDVDQIPEILRKSSNEQVVRAALCYSVVSQNISILKCILNEISYVEIGSLVKERSQCNCEESPMHAACSLGNDEALSLLIHSGFLINVVDEYHRTPLWNAISNAQNSVIDTLLSRDDINVGIFTSGSVEEIQDRNVTVLMKATITNNTKAVLGICRHNPDPNIVDVKRRTPLHYACMYGNLECVKILISCGSDVNARDNDRISPLYAACKKGHTDVVLLLLNSGAQINNIAEEKMPLMTAIYNGHTDVVNALLSRNSDINIDISNGRTPLHVACSEGTLDMVKVLVNKGADINLTDSFEQTPLFFCMRNGKFQIGLGVFLNNINNNAGDQMHAYLDEVEEGNKIMKFLIEEGAIINCKDANGLSPIDYALNTHRIFSTHILLKYGAKIQCNKKKFLQIMKDNVKGRLPNMVFFQILLKHDLDFRKLVPLYEDRSEDLTQNANQHEILFEIGQCATLKNLCRITIRNCISADTGLGYAKRINALVLPKSMISFLMFEDMDQMVHLRDDYQL